MASRKFVYSKLKQLGLVIALCSLVLKVNYAVSVDSRADESCISHKDFFEVSQKFTQFKMFLKTGKADYCFNDLDKSSFILVETLVMLKNAKLKRALYSTKDDFSKQVFPGDNWWEYLISKVNRFNLKPSECHDYRGAYIMSDNPGQINLCPPFFSKFQRDPTVHVFRAALLLHERRHFDNGYIDHVICTENKQQKHDDACDPSIDYKGSFAIQIQSAIDMAFNSDIKGLDKKRIFMQAYWLANEFINKPINILYSHYIYLQNDHGEIWRWNSNNKDPIRFVHKLNETAQIFVSKDFELAVYPYSKSQLAYRLDTLEWKDSASIGTFAQDYNRHSSQEKEQYLSFNYTTATQLTRNKLNVSCRINDKEKNLTTTQFPEEMKTLISLDSTSGNNFVLSRSGRIYNVICPQNAKQIPHFRLTNMSAPQDIKSLFFIDNNYWGLTDQGRLVQLQKSQNNFVVIRNIDFQLENQNWTELAVQSVPQSLEEVVSRPK